MGDLKSRERGDFRTTSELEASRYSQGECSLDPLKKLVVEIIAFSCTLGSLETDSG